MEVVILIFPFETKLSIKGEWFKSINRRIKRFKMPCYKNCHHLYEKSRLLGKQFYLEVNL